MPTTPSEDHGHAKLDRALIHVLIDHESGCSRARLETELRHHAPHDVNDAVERLNHAGAVELQGETVTLHPGIHHVYELGLIGI